MIGKNFSFNGVRIPWSTTEGMSAGWYADVNWDNVATRNYVTSRQDWHGTIAKPTYADGRIIDVRGEIFHTSKHQRGIIRDVIADLFKIQDFPSEDNEFKKLEFTDDDDTDWFMWAKVYTMPEYQHERGEPIIGFSTQLYASDPLIYSKNPVVVSGIYGLFGGITLPVELPTDLDGGLNVITCTNNGNFSAKAKITITGQIQKPKIYNLLTGRFFKLNIDVNQGDTLIIDTNNSSVTLNGNSVLANRTAGSNWLFVNSGTNYFLLMGDDFDFDNQSKAQIQIEFYHTKLV